MLLFMQLSRYLGRDFLGQAQEAGYVIHKTIRKTIRKKGDSPSASEK
jgi:hypothetical protein